MKLFDKDIINPGAFDRTIDIVTTSYTLHEDTGEEIAGNETSYTLRAQVKEEMPSNEVFENQGIQYKQMIEVTCRYRAFVQDTKKHLIYKGNRYDINSVVELSLTGRKRFMRIKAVRYE